MEVDSEDAAFPNEDELKSYFPVEVWNSMADYDKKTYRNILHNYNVMTALDLKPKKPSFMMDEYPKESSKRRAIRNPGQAVSLPKKREIVTRSKSLRTVKHFNYDLLTSKNLNKTPKRNCQKISNSLENTSCPHLEVRKSKKIPTAEVKRSSSQPLSSDHSNKRSERDYQLPSHSRKKSLPLKSAIKPGKVVTGDVRRSSHVDQTQKSIKNFSCARNVSKMQRKPKCIKKSSSVVESVHGHQSNNNSTHLVSQLVNIPNSLNRSEDVVNRPGLNLPIVSNSLQDNCPHLAVRKSEKFSTAEVKKSTFQTLRDSTNKINCSIA